MKPLMSLAILAVAGFSQVGWARWCGFPSGTVAFTASAGQPFRQNLNRMLLDPTMGAVFQSDDLPAWLSIDRDNLQGTAPATLGETDFHLSVLCEDGEDEAGHPASITVH